MSEYGLFEADEAAQHQPRLAARTAAVKLEAAVGQVRRQFGRFLIAATGIDEFEDRWHLSKNDIRASVEPHVFPNTGTMRRIHNALKADWKLAHPYKVGLSHGEAGFGSMPEGDGPPKNQHLEETYHPSSGNLIPKGDFEGWKDSVDQDGPEKVEAHDFTPGGDSGSDRHARRRSAASDDGPEYGCDHCGKNVPDGAGHYVGDDRLCASCADKSDKKEGRRRQAGGAGSWYDQAERADDYNYKRDTADKSEDDENKKEAAMLVADIYTDFAQSNGLRVASLDTLDHYASTGIAESDYRLLESMIIRAAEEKDDDSDDDENDESEESDSESDEAPDFGGEDSDSDDDDDDSEESDDEDDSSDDDDDDDEDYDFGGEEGGQTYTVPEQAPELDPQLMGEIPQDDTDGSAPVPPEVIDSLLGLPEGTIEQLLLEEVEQGAQGGDPQAGGDDFLGGAGGDNTQPPRMARRRQAKSFTLNPDDPDWIGHHSDEDLADNEAFWNGPGGHDIGGEQQAAVLRMLQQERDRRTGGREAARRFWAAPDEDEAALMARQRRQQRDAIQTKFPTGKPNVRDLYKRARGGDLEAYAELRSLWNQRGWTASKAARTFWAAEGDEQQSEGGGEQQAPQDPVAAQGVDPAAMGMMPPPGSQAVQPPAPPQPIEDQPAEDALLDTANQAIMQMIDRETQEYQQIIDPLSQALQAIQFAQQVEQSEHPMDVTPPQGTVNVDPSQAPGGAGNPMQQQAMRRRKTAKSQKCDGCGDSYPEDDLECLSDLKDYCPDCADEREGETCPDCGSRPKATGFDGEVLGHESSCKAGKKKKSMVLRNAARLIAGRYGLSHGGERMLVQAMGRRQYEHVREALQLLPPEHLSQPEHRAAVRHIGEMFAAENPRFNKDVWMRSVLGSAPGSRLPFDRARRTAGETWTQTPTMDAFEFPGAGQVPRVDDNNDSNNLPVMNGADPHGKNVKQADILKKLRNWLQRQQQMGLNYGGDVAAEGFINTRRKPLGPRATEMVHQEVGADPHPPVETASPAKPRNKPPKAVNPVTKRSRRRRGAGVFLDDLNDESENDPSRLHCSRCGHSEPGGHELPAGSLNLCPRCAPAAVMDYQFYGHPSERLSDEFRQNPGSGYGDALFRELEHRAGMGDHDAARAVIDEVKARGPRGNSREMDRPGEWESVVSDAIKNPGTAEVLNDFDTDDPDRTYDSGSVDTFDPVHPKRRKVPAEDYRLPAEADPRYNRNLLSNRRDATWGEWEPTKQASFFTRRVPGWRWDDHLNGYVSKEGKAFTCSCGEGVPSPSYKTCGCGKVWNVYAIGDTHHLASDSAEMFIAREIPVRDNVIMANRKMAGILDDYNGDWGEYFNSWAKWGNDDVCGDPFNEGCREPLNDGEGYDGYCGNCADRLDEEGHWDGRDEDKPDQLDPKDYVGWDPDDNPGPDDPRIKGASLFMRLAGDGMSWEDTMRYIDQALQEGESDDNSNTLRVGHEYEPHPQGQDFCTSESEDGELCGLPPSAHPDFDYQRQLMVDPSLINQGRGPVYRARKSHQELLAMIDKLADWTKYEDDVDPAVEAYGKNKPPSTTVSRPPKDWARRKPAGDPGKRGGTWTPPTIPHKKK